MNNTSSSSMVSVDLSSDTPSITTLETVLAEERRTRKELTIIATIHFAVSVSTMIYLFLSS